MLRRVVFNQKGGVGKSSITVNLAAIAAARGYRTLVIDLDPQCNSSQYLLGEKATHGQGNPALEPNVGGYFESLLNVGQSKGLIGSALGSILKSKDEDLADYIHPTRFERLSVIPASPTLGEMEHALQSKHKIFKLRDALKALEKSFDLVFIDTAPAFNFYTLAALIAGDRVVIPFDCDVFSHRALQTLLENVVETKSDHNPQLNVEGIVVNQYQARANLPQQVVQGLKDDGLPVFESMLPPSIIMKESHQKNQPLIHLDDEHKLTLAYVALFDEMNAMR
ncbi:MAG: ParA family protein [Pseudomonadota bacterium]|nr:ParA family protein [Pseudomonadota bacterium]